MVAREYSSDTSVLQQTFSGRCECDGGEGCGLDGTVFISCLAHEILQRALGSNQELKSSRAGGT